MQNNRIFYNICLVLIYKFIQKSVEQFSFVIRTCSRLTKEHSKSNALQIWMLYFNNKFQSE